MTMPISARRSLTSSGPRGMRPRQLDFFGRIYGLGGKELKERVDDVLRVVALTDRADDAVETFSGGMKRRVNIAAGLVHLP